MFLPINKDTNDFKHAKSTWRRSLKATIIEQWNQRLSHEINDQRSLTKKNIMFSFRSHNHTCFTTTFETPSISIHCIVPAVFVWALNMGHLALALALSLPLSLCTLGRDVSPPSGCCCGVVVNHCQ